MDWFQRLTGFEERDYDYTQARLTAEGASLQSLVNGRSYGIGELEVVSLDTLRRRVIEGRGPSGSLKVKAVSGNIRDMHGYRSLAGALFQVASQFNLLEMTEPSITPEHGVTRYQSDLTQGPACAIAAGAATIYRNYFLPLPGGIGQKADRQIDCLAPIGEMLAERLGRPVETLWTMRNGYALCTDSGLRAIDRCLAQSSEAELDVVRTRLRIGIHRDVEVTDFHGAGSSLVSQAFCSALPVAYCDHPLSVWRRFACLILEAAYEATLCAAVLNARRGSSRIALLTRLGGGAFGNAGEWIDAAMIRALERMREVDIEVWLVSFGDISASMRAIERHFA